jgi:hypothetical protein
LLEKGFKKEAEFRFENLKTKNNKFIKLDINCPRQMEKYSDLKTNNKRIDIWANKD